MSSHSNKHICKQCRHTFLKCECIDLCKGKFNKEDITMAFMKFPTKSFSQPKSEWEYCKKKIEIERRLYFYSHYSPPKKIKKIKFNIIR